MCRKLMEEDKGDNRKTVHSSHASSLKTKKINQREVIFQKRDGFTERRGRGRDETLYNRPSEINRDIKS
jgi:hypothetical protein